MKLELKKIKHARNLSQETNAFTADVYIDGKLVGEALNQGNGGTTWVYPKGNSNGLLAEAQDHFRALPPHQSEYGPLPMSLDFAIDLAIEEDLEKRRIARACKGKTAFRLKHQPKGEFYTINQPFSDRVKSYLLLKHGENLEIIYNETI